MKDKDEQAALIGMAIGAAVISLVATQKLRLIRGVSWMNW